MVKVLIAEDDRISQKLAGKMVDALGHAAFVSPNGRHAYEALQAENDFEILITDIMMPEMDGRELIRKLRNSEQYAHLPIIIMSAVVGLNEISSLLKEGATLFLPKPLKIDDLKDYLHRCIDKKACSN